MYKNAFSHLLWWLYKLRRRFVMKNQCSETSHSFTYPKWGRERLAILEYLMPKHFMTIIMHLAQHLCKTLLYTGPPHGTWMFVFERWIQIAKGLLHSPFSAAEGLMKAVMTHEWQVRNSVKTKQDLDLLLTPPLSNLLETRIITPLGIHF